MLLSIELAELDSGELGESVAFVGGFERTAQQMLFLHRLRAVSRIDATGGEVEDFGDAIFVSRMEQVESYQQIIMEKVHGRGLVGEDASYFSGGNVDLFRSMVADKPVDFRRIAKIRMPEGQDEVIGGVSSMEEFTGEGAADHATVACHVDRRSAHGVVLFDGGRNTTTAQGNGAEELQLPTMPEWPCYVNGDWISGVIHAFPSRCV